MQNVSALILSLNTAEAGAVPEWLHLLPASSFTGVDGRGPFAAPDLAGLVATFRADGRKLAVDENHAIDLAGKAGLPSPARGWIVELQARNTGLWGRVEWTDEGRALVLGKAYGYLSPVFLHSKAAPYTIAKVLRVALTNDPNLDFLTSLHSKQEPEMLEQLRKALGLPETATEAEALAAVSSLHATNTAHVALLADVRTAVGVAATADATALVAALQSRGKVTADEAVVADLKGQIVTLQTQLTTLATDAARERASSVVEDAIKAGKIVPALREHMIARHARNPAEVEAEISLMPSLFGGGLGGRQPPEIGAATTGEDERVLAQMGLDPKAFADQAKALHGKGN